MATARKNQRGYGRNCCKHPEKKVLEWKWRRAPVDGFGKKRLRGTPQRGSAAIAAVHPSARPSEAQPSRARPLGGEMEPPRTCPQGACEWTENGTPRYDRAPASWPRARYWRRGTASLQTNIEIRESRPRHMEFSKFDYRKFLYFPEQAGPLASLQGMGLGYCLANCSCFVKSQ